MSKITVLLCLLIGLNGLAQIQPKPDLFPETVDSIRFTAKINVTKEMILPGNTPYSETIGTVRLDQKETQKLIKKFVKKGSYESGKALLTHDNLTFLIYSKNSQLITVEISTLTRNIYCFFPGDDYFSGKISKKMGNYLIKLLTKYRFYDPLHERGDLEGIL